MSGTRFTCAARDCESQLVAGDDDEAVTCNVCGHENTPPWGERDETDAAADAPVTRTSDGRVVCQRCSEPFDPDRDPSRPGQDTSRCPSCGAQHDVTAPDVPEQVSPPPSRSTDESAVSDVVRDAVECADGEDIHIHIHYHE